MFVFYQRNLPECNVFSNIVLENNFVQQSLDLKWFCLWLQTKILQQFPDLGIIVFVLYKDFLKPPEIVKAYFVFLQTIFQIPWIHISCVFDKHNFPNIRDLS